MGLPDAAHGLLLRCPAAVHRGRTDPSEQLTAAAVATGAGQETDSGRADGVRHRRTRTTGRRRPAMTTTIRTTCSSCQLTCDIPAASLVLSLPAPGADPSGEPSFAHICPGCRTCDATAIPWRTAAYLLHAGATALTAPDAEQIQPRYPERRPATDSP